MPEKVLINIYIFNSGFVDDFNNLYIDKANKKNRPVIHACNDEKKIYADIFIKNTRSQPVY